MPEQEFDLERPPWSVEAGGTGNSDDWGDEQDRSEWFEAAANYWCHRYSRLAEDIPRASITQLVEYNWSDESHDYEEQIAEGNIEPDDPAHIFTHMNKIDDWLSYIDIHAPVG